MLKRMRDRFAMPDRSFRQRRLAREAQARLVRSHDYQAYR